MKSLERRAAFEWPTWAMLLIAYGSWGAAGYLLWPVSPWAATAVMAVASALHASLQHEMLHGHPTRSATANEALVFLPLSLFYPYRRFKTLHLRHHADERLTDPYDDPESFYMARRDHERLSGPLRLLLDINNTLIGRMLIGPALMVYAFLANERPLLLANAQGVRRAWAHHMAGMAMLAALLWFVFAIPLWAYVPAAYGAMSLIAVRTFCEHQWSETPDGRTIIVEKSRLLSWLFLNNNLHLVHHKLPAVPWYRLPALYKQRSDEWRAMNGHYVCSSYIDILRSYGLRRKEPVVHPVLRREVEPGHDIRLKTGAFPVPARQQAD